MIEYLVVSIATQSTLAEYLGVYVQRPLEEDRSEHQRPYQRPGHLVRVRVRVRVRGRVRVRVRVRARGRVRIRVRVRVRVREGFSGLRCPCHRRVHGR